MILKKISGDDEVFNALPDRNEKITYDLLRMIKDGEPHTLLSDGKSCIAAQTSPRLPLWIYLREKPGDALSAELSGIISAAVMDNAELHVMSDPLLIIPVLDAVGRSYRTYMKMNAYACRKPASAVLSGRIVPASEAYRADMKRLLGEMIKDAVGEDADDNATDGFAEYAIASGNVFLWEDGGRIASMANIASRTADTARLNTIVTERELRGRGYAGMLVTELCKTLLSDGLTPMLYADAANPASNKAYEKAGFEFFGTVCEFAFTGKNGNENE